MILALARLDDGVSPPDQPAVGVYSCRNAADRPKAAA